MARVGGIEATARLQRQTHRPEVLVLTTFDADADVLSALRAGAAGYPLKDTPPAGIVEAMVRVAGELAHECGDVKAHVSHILTKLDLQNRTQIALLAHDAKLV